MTINTPWIAPLVRPLPARKHFLAAVAVLAMLSAAPPAVSSDSLDDYKCGVLDPPGQYGPYDYRTATVEQKILVEGAHFSRQTELLIKGTSQTSAGPDVDYTLRAFPNHPRALKSMIDLRFRDKANPPTGMRYTAECWFNRAIRFTPDDGNVRMIYGVFLLRSGQKKGAVEQFELARASGMSSANFHYNLGLAYFQVQDYEKARIQAYKAKEMGYELDGLKKLLMKAGQWRDPPPVAPKPPEGGQQKAEESKTERSAAPAN